MRSTSTALAKVIMVNPRNKIKPIFWVLCRCWCNLLIWPLFLCICCYFNAYDDGHRRFFTAYYRQKTIKLRHIFEKNAPHGSLHERRRRDCKDQKNKGKFTRCNAANRLAGFAIFGSRPCHKAWRFFQKCATNSRQSCDGTATHNRSRPLCG